MRKLYFNGFYIIKGYKLFGKISGKVISTSYPSVYNVNDKVSIPAETFKKITPQELDRLKDWGFVPSEK